MNLKKNKNNNLPIISQGIGPSPIENAIMKNIKETSGSQPMLRAVASS